MMGVPFEILFALGLAVLWATIIIAGIVQFAEGDDDDGPRPSGGAA